LAVTTTLSVTVRPVHLTTIPVPCGYKHACINASFSRLLTN